MNDQINLKMDLQTILPSMLQNYRYRWNIDSIPPVFLYYTTFRNITTANSLFSFTAFSAVCEVPVSPLPSLPKGQGFRQILQAVYYLPSWDWITAVVLPPGLPCTVVALLSAAVGLTAGIRVVTGVAACCVTVSPVFTN